MGLLESLLGAGDEREGYQDFLQRYDQGPPYEGISDEEASNRYDEITPHLGQRDYEQAAADAYGRMSPEERMQLGRYLHRQAHEQGVDVSDFGDDPDDDRFADSGLLSAPTGRVREQQPGLLGQLLGGGMGQGGGGGVGKAALAGIAAMAARRFMPR